MFVTEVLLNCKWIVITKRIRSTCSLNGLGLNTKNSNLRWSGKDRGCKHNQGTHFSCNRRINANRKRFALQSPVPGWEGQSATFGDESLPREVCEATRRHNMGIWSWYKIPLCSSTLSCTLWMAVCGLVAWDQDTPTSPRVTVPHRKVWSFAF